MRVLDLFSGIGGFSLGLERAGMTTAAFCEIRPFCRRVLAKRWPGVPIYDDVRTLTRSRLRADGIDRIDAICGGFPCQNISASGDGTGITGEQSGLWVEFARIIGDFDPTYVIIENSPLLRSRGLGRVLKDLWALRLDAEWHVIPAAAAGACHERERIWVIAYPEGHGCRAWGPRGLADRLAGLSDAPRWHAGPPDGKAPWPDEPALLGVDDDVPDRVDRGHALGNSLVPAIPEIIGRAIMAAAQ